MQIEINQWQHSGGTVEVFCKIKSICNSIPCTDLYSVAKLNKCYNLEKVGWKLYIEDVVEDPKNLSDLDWQLLKITNHDIEPYQWQIFKLLKDLLDNRATEDDTVTKVKEVLEQYEV
jgi:hypothetical protein